jgi:hypothetical protein
VRQHRTGPKKKVSVKTITNLDAARLVLDAIESAGRQEKQAKADKLRLIRLGRAHGHRWRDIAERLDVTDSAVIQLIQRSDAA